MVPSGLRLNSLMVVPAWDETLAIFPELQPGSITSLTMFVTSCTVVNIFTIAKIIRIAGPTLLHVGLDTTIGFLRQDQTEDHFLVPLECLRLCKSLISLSLIVQLDLFTRKTSSQLSYLVVIISYLSSSPVEEINIGINPNLHPKTQCELLADLDWPPLHHSFAGMGSLQTIIIHSAQELGIGRGMNMAPLNQEVAEMFRCGLAAVDDDCHTILCVV